VNPVAYAEPADHKTAHASLAAALEWVMRVTETPCTNRLVRIEFGQRNPHLAGQGRHYWHAIVQTETCNDMSGLQQQAGETLARRIEMITTAWETFYHPAPGQEGGRDA
jgi:hypothetical protein